MIPRGVRWQVWWITFCVTVLVIIRIIEEF